jgi:hypothetical protein
VGAGRAWVHQAFRVYAGLFGVRNLLGFNLDSALHQDPRYHRSTGRGMWRRTKHAFRETILAHKDAGGETLATLRLGSAYGAAFIANEWYPDRVNTVALGISQGMTQLGFDLLSNLGSEFWPDIKRNCCIASRNLHDHPWSFDAGPSSRQHGAFPLDSQGDIRYLDE